MIKNKNKNNCVCEQLGQILDKGQRGLKTWLPLLKNLEQNQGFQEQN